MTPAASRLDVLIDEVALECQVMPLRVRSNHRTPAAVDARQLVAFIARWDLDLEAGEIATALKLPVQSVRRHIREADRRGRTEVMFGARLLGLRRSA